MSSYLQQLLHEMSLKIRDLELRNKAMEEECKALREQLNELL
jgi:hypothetical protein